MRRLKHFFFVLALFATLPVHAATLSFVSGQSYAVGDSVPVSVVVSSAQSINAVGATVSYPQDKLNLVSISKAGSIINFWAQDPSSAGAGAASLQGIVFDPGYTGTGGRVVQLIFRAKAPGQAAISFGDAQVLANDGKGTNVLTAAPGAVITIGAAKPQPAPAQTPVKTPAPTPLPTATTTATGTPLAPAQGPSWIPQALTFAGLVLAFILGWLMGSKQIRRRRR